MYVCTSIYTLYKHICIHMHLSISAYVRTDVHTHVLFMSLWTCLSVCLSVCLLPATLPVCSMDVRVSVCASVSE